MAVKEYPTQRVLELACAAQRINGEYLKEITSVFTDEGTYAYSKTPNKILMFVTLDSTKWTADPAQAPMPLKVYPEDVAMADEIRTYFKRLMFAAIAGDNEFQTTVNSILSSETVQTNQFGYVACLPSVYKRDRAQNDIKKAVKATEDGYLGEIGSQITDADAEILSSVKSKNFEGYNIDAIINNKMVSWLNKTGLNLGACVVIKAKIKDHTKHWKHQNDVTRLNYVKAAQ